MSVAPEILDIYTHQVSEADRLTSSADGRLELLRTQELLRAVLPPTAADVLDVGGGPGVRARRLAADSYRVHLVAPVPRHVEQAAAFGLSAELADARNLSFQTPDELAAEVTTAGFADVTVHGVEGPAWGGWKAAELVGGRPFGDDLADFGAALRAARPAEPYPDLLAASSHLLAVARA